jgi:hypothetical protein
VIDRAACSGRILGEDPSGDGPGLVMTPSFRVEVFGSRRRPRLGRTSPKVLSTEGAAAPFKRQDPSLQDRIVL